NPKSNRFGCRKMFLSLQVAFHRARFVIDDVYVAASQMIIGQLHDVIKVFARPTDMQNVDETGVRARDRFEAGHAFEFTSKRALAFERAAINDLERPPCSRESAREPNLRKRRGRSLAALRGRE